MSKTIAEHMVDVLRGHGCDAVMYGDCGLLDACAERCTHTTLMDAHPMNRHKRILDALDASDLFEKSYDKLSGFRGVSLVRCFHLKDNSDSQEG